MTFDHVCYARDAAIFERERARGGCQSDKACDACGAPWAQTWLLFIGGRVDRCERCMGGHPEVAPDREPEGPEIL